MTETFFWKTETIGNDFVLVRLDETDPSVLPALAVELCDRKTGIGADGLLAVSPAPWGLSLRMFNQDGSEDFCGNGLRCAGWHGRLEGWVNGEFEILHGGRRIPTQVFDDGRVSVLLPPADFRPEAVPVLSATEFVDQSLHGLTGTAVSTGSAHFVVLVDALPGEADFFEKSPLVENDPVFPERVSVMYAQPVADDRLALRIWERGVGETLGCGTGSSAVAAVWSRQTGQSGPIVVVNPGGDLTVRLDDWRSPIASESKPVRVYAGRTLSEAKALTGRASLV